MNTRRTFTPSVAWVAGGILLCGGGCGLVRLLARTVASAFPMGGLRPKDDAFQEAATRGDYAEVKRFLDAGKDPDAKGLEPYDEGGGALLGALILRHYDVAELLVSRGADINRKHRRRSLLFQFAREDNMEAYRWLAQHGAKRDPEAEALLRLPPERRYDHY